MDTNWLVIGLLVLFLVFGIIILLSYNYYSSKKTDKDSKSNATFDQLRAIKSRGGGDWSTQNPANNTQNSQSSTGFNSSGSSGPGQYPPQQ